MADKNTILALNLGSQRVTLGRFILGKKGAITLRDLATEEIPGDVTADTGRIGYLKGVVKSLAKQIKARDEEVIYAIPSQHVITRPVKLPALGDDQADKIVGFEAQQAVPFPLSETVWDYQIISKDGPEAEVLIAAVRAELLEELNEAVEGAGLKPFLADAAPFALYNAFRFNYGVPEECTLLIDMGARTTDAIFMEGEKVFIANLPNAGGHVSQAISREMGSDYDEAEAGKRESGFVNLGGNYADHEDPAVDAMSKIIRNQFTRLHADINRRVAQYKQSGGSAPVRIYLAGGASALPYTKEFFEEKFRVEVEWFSALGNVPLGPRVDQDLATGSAHTLGELVGLALRASGKVQPLDIDLSPRSVEAAKDLKAKKPKLFLAAALLLGSLGAWWMFNNNQIAKHEANLAKLEREHKDLRKEADAITGEKNKGNKAEAWSNHLQNALSGRQHWLNVLNSINKTFKSNTLWLTQVSPLDPEGKPLTDQLFTKDPLTVTLDQLTAWADKVEKAAPNAATDATTIDSILVSGLWKNQDQEAAKKLFEELRAMKDLFDIPDDWDAKNANQWLAANYGSTQAKHAASFHMRLKLKNKLKVRLLPSK